MANLDQNAKPTEDIDVRDVFGVDSDMKVRGFAERTDRVPELDPTYKFDPDTTLAILAGFAYNRQHFTLVHRSQRDPLINDPDAPTRVLAATQRRQGKGQPVSRKELEDEFKGKDRKNIGEAAQYGVYFDDTDYDYMQHLRPIGGTYNAQRGGKDEEMDVDFMDDRCGSIEPGKLADLVVLSDDLLTVPEDRIRDLRSTMTMVDGRILHEA